MMPANRTDNQLICEAYMSSKKTKEQYLKITVIKPCIIDEVNPAGNISQVEIEDPRKTPTVFYGKKIEGPMHEGNLKVETIDGWELELDSSCVKVVPTSEAPQVYMPPDEGSC